MYVKIPAIIATIVVCGTGLRAERPCCDGETRGCGGGGGAEDINNILNN